MSATLYLRTLMSLALTLASHIVGLCQDSTGPALYSFPSAEETSERVWRLDWTTGDTMLRVSAARRLAEAWNQLVKETKREQKSFTSDENDALDAILMQIQEGLVQIGFRASANFRVRRRPHYVQQLVPNTRALQ